MSLGGQRNCGPVRRFEFPAERRGSWFSRSIPYQAIASVPDRLELSPTQFTPCQLRASLRFSRSTMADSRSSPMPQKNSQSSSVGVIDFSASLIVKPVDLWMYTSALRMTDSSNGRGWGVFRSNNRPSNTSAPTLKCSFSRNSFNVSRIALSSFWYTQLVNVPIGFFFGTARSAARLARLAIFLYESCSASSFMAA